MKVTIVGMGAVGTEITGFLVNMAEVSEIVAIDRNRERVEGEILDFSHTTSFTYAKNPRMVVGDYADSAGSDIVVITAGAQLTQGQTRDDLVRANSVIIREIIAEVERYSPGAIVIVVTNPVDVITWVALKSSSFPRERLFSSGTLLDSARFMRIVSDHVGIDPKNIFGYMLGEHGSTGFIPWSICNVCGLDIDTYCRLNGIPLIDKAAVSAEVRNVGYEIFNRKGNTNHGIAAAVFRLIRAIEADERSVLPVGVLLQDQYGVDDVVMSVPCVVGRNGVERIVNYAFGFDEQAALHRSADHIKSLIALAQ
ncbi:L-lactate dehydrogenase [Formivibrio citricus]|uniref:L-lactate dehydrogenase n=1 Tax=Formivibrio citricus TaxID=83765 RepID=A0A1I4XDX2_9NEIS|nr:L-lactate dehydrogenase [Formivibrio citricus]SFN23975.1 L-lactate dehydrogenase [Formivibrio citricus]